MSEGRGPAGTGLELVGVTLALAGRRLFRPLSCAIPPGTVTTLTGPSGSGKSSLLGFVSGFLDPAFAAEGEVRLDGASLLGEPPERRRLGILFQNDLLFPHLTVAGNLAFGLPPGGRRAERRHAVEQALAEAGLAGAGERSPANLSGGERARAALMRTLLAEPRALLLDEPFGALDRALRADIRRFVFDRARRRNLPVLLVSHDPEDAAAAGGPVLDLRPESV